jgi:hypothetical protein
MSEKLIPAEKWADRINVFDLKNEVDRIQRNAFEATKAALMEDLWTICRPAGPLKLVSEGDIESLTFEEVRDG